MKYVGKFSDALAKQFWIFDLLEYQFIKNALNVYSKPIYKIQRMLHK